MPLLTRFKWSVVLFLSGLAIGPLFSQSTTISVTVVDQGGQTWTNGTISYVFQGNGSFSGKYQWNGANLPNQYLTPTIVALNGSGFATFSVPTTTAISPSGSSWKYVVCPNASAINCPVINIPAIGTTQNISSTVTANAPPISLNPTPMPLAYADTEIQTVPNQGGIYFNTTSFVPRYWNGTAWVNFGSGGGASPANPSLSLQFNNAGSFGATLCSVGDGTAVNIGCSFGNAINGGDNYTSWGESCLTTNIPGFVFTHNIAASNCYAMFGRNTFSGWNLGNSGVTGGNGWYNSNGFNINLYSQDAGISSAMLITSHCAGVGDCNVIDANPRIRGGTSAYSDEGASYQLKLLEDIQTNGTIQTGGGGTGANTLTVFKNQDTDGVGQLILDTTDDVISTTMSAVSTASNYAVATIAATVPVSTVCSTVVSNVAVPTQAEGTYSLFTVNLNTTVDLTSAAASHLLITTVSPYIETNKLVSAGTFTGTTQNVTVMLNKSIAAASPYCVGGMSGRAFEQVPFTISGQIYAMRVIGSPTNHTVEVTYMTSQGPKPDFVGARAPMPMAIKLYHSATIVGGVATVSNFNISDNDAAWTNGANWISTNFVTNTYVYNIAEIYTNPYLTDSGFSHEIAGLAIQMVDSYSSKNRNSDGNYLTYGGIYGAPIAMHVYGQHGAGFLFENAPESLVWSGNFWRGAAISMGPIPGGSNITEWTIADYRTNDDRFSYSPSTGIWNIIGTGGATLNASQICTVANIASICAVAAGGTVTHTVGPLALNKFMLGNGSADSKTDTTAGTDGVGNITGLSLTLTGTTPGFQSYGAGTGTLAGLLANSAGFAGPVTGGTSYLIQLPGTISAAGIAHLANTTTINGVLQSVMTNSLVSLTTDVSGILPIANGGTGTITPGLVAGTNITLSGSWPNQTINATGGGSSPLTTKGDLYGFDTANNRIPVGADTFVLTADSTTALGVKWAAATSGFANPMTTAGDLILATGGGTATRLGIGSNTFVLTSNGTTASWQAATGGASSLSSLTAATASATIANGNNPIVWNWAQTTNSQTAFTFGETTAATGTTDKLLALTTLSGSTAVPLTITNSATSGQSTHSFDINPTWNVGSTFAPTALNINVTNTLSSATARLLALQVGGTNMFLVDVKGFAKGTAFGSSGTKFTGTGCGISTTVGGASAGTFTVTSGTCSVVVTINGATGLTATNGWSCFANDRTTAAVGFVEQTADTTTTATFSIPTTVVSGDVINYACTAY